MTCTKCEDYCTETEKTLALHVALVHDAIQPYLDDLTLVQAKSRQSSKATPPKQNQLPPLKISNARLSAAPTLFSSEVLNQVFSEPNCPVCLLPFATVITGKGLATGGGGSQRMSGAAPRKPSLFIGYRNDGHVGGGIQTGPTWMGQ